MDTRAEPPSSDGTKQEASKSAVIVKKSNKYIIKTCIKQTGMIIEDILFFYVNLADFVHLQLKIVWKLYFRKYSFVKGSASSSVLEYWLKV